MNLTAIYSKKSRQISLIFALITGMIWGVEKLHPIFSGNFSMVLLWGHVFALSVANFSETGGDRRQNLLRRYLTFKSVLCVLIGFLMAISFMETVFSLSFTISALSLVFVINLGLLLIEYGLRIGESDIELVSEGFKDTIYKNKIILWSWGVLTLLTFLAILAIC